MTVPFPAGLIARKPYQVRQTDVRSNNCQGHVSNGNCVSNPQWDMPNTNWWTWGIGVSRYNPGYDFAGGTTTTDQPWTSANSYFYGSYSSAIKGTLDDQTRSFNNCNCSNVGSMLGNCYTNCNCNCACACDCRD